MRVDIVCLYFVSRYKEEVILYLVLVVECHSKDHQLFLKSPKFDKPPQQVYEYKPEKLRKIHIVKCCRIDSVTTIVHTYDRWFNNLCYYISDNLTK